MSVTTETTPDAQDGVFVSHVLPDSPIVNKYVNHMSKKENIRPRRNLAVWCRTQLVFWN